MKFKLFMDNSPQNPVEKPKLQVKQEGDYTYISDEAGNHVGEMHSSEGIAEKRNAKMIFPDIYKGEPVRRTHGIDLSDNLHGQGLGKLLYLFHMMHYPNCWFYNSQTYPGATNALLKLGKDELAEVHWRQPTNYGQAGGVHINRITPKGMQLAKQKLAEFTPQKRSIFNWFK